MNVLFCGSKTLVLTNRIVLLTVYSCPCANNDVRFCDDVLHHKKPLWLSTTTGTVTVQPRSETRSYVWRTLLSTYGDMQVTFFEKRNADANVNTKNMARYKDWRHADIVHNFINQLRFTLLANHQRSRRRIDYEIFYAPRRNQRVRLSWHTTVHYTCINYVIMKLDISNKWFSSYLSNRKQYIQMNDCKSPLITITHDIPQRQGFILGLVLFLIYIVCLWYNNLPVRLRY